MRRPARGLAAVGLGLVVLALSSGVAPARAQTDYAGLRGPNVVDGLRGPNAVDDLPGNSGSEPATGTPYVGSGTSDAPGAGVAVGYVGVDAGVSSYAGVDAPPAASPEIGTARASSPPSGAADTALAAPPPTPSEDLPPVVTGRDIVSLTTLGGGALIAFAVLIGRRRLR